MKKVFIIKYAELNTKKDNIGMFLRTLKENIERTLEGYSVSITFDKGRMFVSLQDEDFESILERLQKTFGIQIMRWKRLRML